MRLLMLSLGVVLGVGALAAACGGSDETEPFCEAGAFVFCRCQNGDPGTKECNSDGASFAACMAESGGECPEGDDDSSGDPTSTGDPSGPGSGGSGGGSTAPTGGASLFAEKPRAGGGAQRQQASPSSWEALKAGILASEADRPADAPQPQRPAAEKPLPAVEQPADHGRFYRLDTSTVSVLGFERDHPALLKWNS